MNQPANADRAARIKAAVRRTVEALSNEKAEAIGGEGAMCSSITMGSSRT
jgi:hypothetical protein